MERAKALTKGTVGGLFAGAGLAFFFDPRSGTRRRHLLRDRTLGACRRAIRRTLRVGRRTATGVGALAHRAAHLRERPKPELTDETLAAKIRSEVFRDPDLPKGEVNVNVERGVAVLRGQVERPELIEELVARVGKVKGVRDVRSLLHLPA